MTTRVHTFWKPLSLLTAQPHNFSSLNLHFHFVPLNKTSFPLSVFQLSSPKKRVSVLFINLSTLGWVLVINVMSTSYLVAIQNVFTCLLEWRNPIMVSLPSVHSAVWWPVWWQGRVCWPGNRRGGPGCRRGRGHFDGSVFLSKAQTS